MFGTGFLAGLIAKLAGLGSVAKIAIGTVTAALTMAAAAAGTGVLPIGTSHPGAAVTQKAVEQATGGGQAATTTSAQNGGHASGGNPVVTPGAPTSVTADAGAGAGASVKTPAVATPSASSTPPAGTGLPDLSGLTQIPTQVMSCLTPILDLVKGGVPTVSQLTGIGPSIVGCVSGIVKALPLPFGLNACISNIMGFVANITSQVSTGGVPSLGGLDVASCIPKGLPVPTGLPGMGGGFPFGG